MTNPTEKCAVLLTAGEEGLPVIALAVPVEFQFCVDAGAAAAYRFFDDRTTVGLHDHIAVSMQAFMHSIRTTHAPCAQLIPGAVEWNGYTDAFAAGYLGRIQQELRCIRARSQGGTTAMLTPRGALH